jgi:hypothetical protein
MDSIIVKYSQSPGVEPVPNQLLTGEPVMNTYDGRLFMKKSDINGDSIVSFVNFFDLPTATVLSASFSSTASFSFTSLFANTASYALQAVNSSFATTASYAINATTSSYSNTSTSASYSNNSTNAITASYVTLSQTASFVTTAQTASYVLNAISSSYSLSSSYALSSSQSTNAITASFVTTLRQNVFITGSLNVSGSTIQVGNNTLLGNTLLSGSVTISGSLTVTSGVVNQLTTSFAINANSASYALNAANAFIQGGNSFGAAAVIGTNDLNNLSLEVNNSTRLFISGSGNYIGAYRTNRFGNHEPTINTFEVDGIIRALPQSGASGSFETYGNNNTPVLYTSRTDNTVPGVLTFNGWGDYAFNNSLLIGYTPQSSGYGTGNLYVSNRIGIAKTSSNATLDVNGNTIVTGSLNVTSGITGSLFGSSTTAISSSYAATSSYADNFTVGNTLTAQRIVVQTITSSIDFVTGSSRNGSLLSNTHEFTGSILVSGSINSASITGSLFGSASNAFSSSYSLSSSQATNAITASFVTTAQTASFVLQAVSSSYALSSSFSSLANTASFVANAQTASFVLNAVSASFGTTSSFALTASFVTPLRQNVQLTGSLFVTSSTVALSLIGSGSGVFSVDGTSGRLFSIDDSLSGSLFSVNTAAGLPVIEAFSDNTVRIGQFGQRALFVASNRVGIGKESPLNASLDVSGSVVISGSLTVSGSIGPSNISDTYFAFKSGSVLGQSLLRQTSNSSILFGEDIVPTSPNSREIAIRGLNYASLTLLVSGSLGTQGYGMGARPGGSFSFVNTANNGAVFTLGSDATSGAFGIAGGTNVLFAGNVAINYPNIYTIPSKFYVSGSSRLDGTLAVSSSVGITGSLSVLNGITGSLFGTSSFALTAQTASFVLNAISASYVLQSVSSSFATLAQTASFVQTAQTASYVLNAISSSYAVTASFVLGQSATSSYALSASNAISASYVLTAQTASYVVTAQTASYVLTAQTASFVSNAISSSFAATSSYADNFTVGNTLTAQRIVVQTITSSIDFVTGSSRNGSLLSNTHEFTGSLFQTGSTAVFMGDVGIGTSPESKFHIFNSTNLGGTTGNYLLLQTLQNPGGAGGNNVYERTWAYRTGTGTDWQSYSIWTGISIDASFGTPTISKTWHWREPLAEKQHFGSGTTNVMTIGPSNVGIGTSSPGFKLDVNGTTRISGNTIMTGSLIVTAGITGSLQGTAATASYVVTAQTASYVLNAVSSSYALTASFVLGTSATSSYALSSSNAVSASYAVTASFVLGTSATSSYALSASNAVSASYALIAPYSGLVGTVPTWNQSTTGNAATSTVFSTGRTNYKGVTDASVAGQLMWKNYGNNHTIFDASAGTSPQGGAVNNTNSAVAWTGTYPTLMGWNGTSTYGVRVDSARIADSLSSMNISQFTNNSGYITSGASISGNAASVTYLPNRTDGTAYQVLWGAAYTNGIGTIAYSCSGVTITSSTGTLTASGITETSSKRYKENIISLENSLDKVIKLRGIKYNKIGNDFQEIGVIAEEVEKVVPEFVVYNKEGQADSVNYGRITVLLIEGMKEQQLQIEKLKAEIQLLKSK